MKVLVINGPNLNRLGKREPNIYGKGTYEDLCKFISDSALALEVGIDFYQSNIEGEIVNAIHRAEEEYDGIIINPGAYTHYSYAILDALKSVNIPAVEVHISNIHKREEFRRHSVTAEGCQGVICGLGFYGYVAALHYLKETIGE